MPLPSDAHLPDETGRVIADPARFCTGSTLAAGEPLAGTGGHQARNILLRWPKGRWEHSLRIAAAMPDDLVAAIQEAVDAGWRVNLIDRKPDQGDCILVFPDAVRLDVTTEDYAAAIRAIVAGAGLSQFSPSPTPPTCIFVCTHGKHDACCAKWGFTAYKALVKAASPQPKVDIWEITHLGGCRLSGGALVLPAGRKYGRLVPADAGPLLAAEARNLPYLPAFRGTNACDAPTQVAEITALTHFKDGTRVSEIMDDGLEGDIRTFTVRTTAGAVRVHCTPETVSSYGACSDLKAGKPMPSRTIWRGKIIKPTQHEGR